MSENIFNSSTRGKMPASGVTKALMHALRIATHEHSKQDSVASATALSEARAEIVQYIGNLETELNAHRWHAAEQKREADRQRRQANIEKGLKAHQRALLQFIDMYSMQPTPASRIFGRPENAKVFGIDFAKVEARTLASLLTDRDPYYRLYTQLREQEVVRQGIA